jgi:hypothetical protein
LRTAADASTFRKHFRAAPSARDASAAVRGDGQHEPVRKPALEVKWDGSGALRGGFASETDLGTGLERPLRRSPGSTDDALVIDYPECPPRTLIRVYWPLEHD